MFEGIELGGFSISPAVQRAIFYEFFIYSAIIVALGLFLKFVRRSKKENRFADFLTGGGGLNSIELALLTAMTLMGGGTMLSAPGLTYRDGFIYTLVNFGYFTSNWLGFTVYGKRMAIIGKRINAQTCAQLVHFRYQSRVVAVIFSLGFALAYTVNTGGQLLSAAKLFSTILGVEQFQVGLFLTGIVILIYTLSGGIKSIAKICVLQGFILIVAVLSLVFVEYRGVVETHGSIRAAMEFTTRNNSILVDARTYSPLYFLGLVLASSWRNTNSPAVLQSAFTFHSTQTLRKSLIMSSVMMMVVQLIMASSGPFIYSLNQNIGNADYSVVYLTTSRLPVWMTGIVIAAIFASIQSSIAAFLLTIAGTMVQDVYKDCINEKATDRQLKWLNYGFVVLVFVISLFIAENQNALAQEILILSGGIAVATQAVPLLAGTFWKRATAGGAIASCILGLSAYAIASYCGETEWYRIFLFDAHPAIPTIVVSIGAMFIGSLLTPNLRVPFGIYRVWFCRDYDEAYTTKYNSLSENHQ